MRTGTHIMPDESVEILIPLKPITKKNHQQIVKQKLDGGKERRFIIPSREYKEYEKEAGYFIKPLGITSPVNVKALFYMDTKRKVDLTNLNEALHDILVKYGCLEDDNANIIVSSDGSRVYVDREYPRTEVYITDTEPTFAASEKIRPKKSAYGIRETPQEHIIIIMSI